MPLIILPVTQSDLTKISLFIKKIYDQAIAPTYSDEGNKEFYKYIHLEAMKKRFGNDHWMLQAGVETNLVGIIEIRKNEHVSMLFVDTLYQKQGIGRQLLSETIAKIKKLNPEQKSLSVHSTPNAVIAYQKLGFKAVSDEQNVNGIRFVTMQRALY